MFHILFERRLNILLRAVVKTIGGAGMSGDDGADSLGLLGQSKEVVPVVYQVALVLRISACLAEVHLGGTGGLEDVLFIECKE